MQERLHPIPSRVVDQDVDRPQLAFGLRHGRARARELGHVDREANRVATDFFRRGLGAGLVEVGERDLAPLLAQALRNSLADSAPRAGDECDLAA